MAQVNIVDFGAMNRAAAAVDDTIAQLGMIRKNMLTALDALDNGWSGSAKNKFYGVLTQWNRSFEDVEKRLNDIYVALTGSRDKNYQNEQDNSPMIDGIEVALLGG
jgi:WXG100 family type VII secretion target